MVTVAELHKEIKQLFDVHGIYQGEVHFIFEEVTGHKLAKLLINPDAVLNGNHVKRIREIADRRITHYPLQYLFGKWEFYGLPMYVGEGVLIPRDDSETLVDAVFDRYRSQAGLCVADLCSGSGCIAITLAKGLENAKISAVELSDRALPYLAENAKLNGVEIDIIKGDVLESTNGLSDLDFIVCNPPYLDDDDMSNMQKEVTYEPKDALYGGRDGLDFYRAITKLWKDALKDGGMLFYEIGIFQDESVSQILHENGFTDIRTASDVCGIKRVVYGKKFENSK